MAKKSMIVKSQRKPKFKVREYTRCSICGRPHAVLRKFGICRICFSCSNDYNIHSSYFFNFVEIDFWEY